MSLRIIYGKSGTGKSTYIFNEIASRIKNGESKIYIITPEQFSFTAEKKLLDTIKNSSVISAEVLTFARMAYRVLKETGSSNLADLSSSGKSMLIYNILSKEKDNLKFIGKSSENIDMIGTQITEFKKHGITPENLKNVMGSTEDKYLKSKLNDMFSVYQKYTDELSSRYIDENDNLTLLAERLELIHDFDGATIYIDEFVGFTMQEYEIIKKLMKVANEVNITVCSDDITLSENTDTDIFYSNKNTLNRLFNLAKSENIQIEKSVLLDKEFRFKSPELKHLEENIYAFPYEKYVEKVENIELFLAKNQYSEIEEVGKKIVKLVRDKDYRYKDISVITKDLEGYSNLCKVIFAKYNIPVFIDEKKDLSQNLLVQYILSFINIFSKNWSANSVLEYIKTDLIDEVDEFDIWKLENYVIRWGIKGSKWYNGDWVFYEETEEEQEKILHIREKIIKPLLSFREDLTRQKTIEDITKRLYQFLIENRMDYKIGNKIAELERMNEQEKAKEYETSYKIIMDVLDDMVSVLGDESVSFEKYAEILKVGLGNSG